MTFIRLSLIQVVYVVAFSLGFSTGVLKAWSWLAGVAFPPGFYIAGGISSVLVFSLCMIGFASLRAWRRTARLGHYRA